MFRVVAPLILFTVFAAGGSYCQQKPCTEAERLQVEKEAVTLRTWDALYKSYRKFRHCDDVDAQEGYSESEARILADRWETLPRLAQLIDVDKSFGRFVGLDATMDMKDVAKIRVNAVKRCPAGLARICSKLKKDADEAIAEDAYYHKQP
jgi:hypothetical protein